MARRKTDRGGVMDFVKRVAGYPVYRTMHQRKLEGQIQEMHSELQEALTQIDILSATAITTDDPAGNQYTDRKTMIDDIYAMYQNQAAWGCQIAQRVINHRKALAMPYGVGIEKSQYAKDNDIDTKREEEFLRRFLDWNNFNEGREDDLCKFTNIEGQMLVTLKWDKEGDGITGLPWVRRKSWRTLQYSVHADSEDPDSIETISWEHPDTKQEVSIKPDSKGEPFAFVAFNDVAFEGMPPVGYVLNECITLHKALSGWRITNKFFAKLTPFFKAEDWDEAKQITSWIKGKGWKLGTGFAGKDMKLVGPTVAAAEMYYQEIRTSVQIISGATSVPVHYLGFADVIGQGRATATTLTEPMEVMSLNELVKWRGFYERVFNLAIRMRNENLNKEGQLHENLVKPKLLPMTDRTFQRLREFWYPVAKDGLVSRELFLEQIPDIDSDKELQRMEQEEMSSANLEQLEALYGEAAVERELSESEEATPEG
jgi:hypothetical protein